MPQDDDVIAASHQTSEEVVVDALRAAVSSSAGVATRPGLLRVRLESALEPDGDRFSAVTHQVVAAAEENLPSLLAGLAPITAESVERVTAQLASTRGWSESTALRTVLIWADALGLERPATIKVPTAPATFSRWLDATVDGDAAGITMVPPPPACPQSPPVDADIPVTRAATASGAGDTPTSLPDPGLTSGAEQADLAGIPAKPSTSLSAKRRAFRRRG